MALIYAVQNTGVTKDIVILNSSGEPLVPISTDKIKITIKRGSNDPVLVVSSDAPTSNGSSFTKGETGTNRLRLDASDLNFAFGVYTFTIEYYDSTDLNEWKVVERHTFSLEAS